MTEITTETTTAPVKGTWQDTLYKSANLAERSAKARKQASALLWDGAVAGIESWLPDADADVSAEAFSAEVLDMLGKSRKGDVSKIKTVALAAKDNGLVLASFPNLSKAYAEATRLTKTVKAQAAEDSAADEAVTAIAANAPKSSSTPEGAALIVLGKGLDEAARLLLDALGTDAGVHRAFLRAISQEIAGRVPKPAPKPPAAPKAVKKATPKAAGDGAAKAKPVAKSASKGDPNKKALPVRAKAAPVTEAAPVEPDSTGATVGDMFDQIEDGQDTVDTISPTAPTKGAPVKRAVPVKRR